MWVVKLPPQNSAGAKKLGGSRAARKIPIISLHFMNFQFSSINSRLSQKLTQVNDVCKG
ncbi:hypothetical protein BACI71_10229 [Bacillus mycoides]|uniref:Uncharacterized protein n=1 Tax=Bacillus mycoides TaxID=1405 RepID=A0A653MAZ8_BACMY|nr:hypothetical protein BACI71_10229 [Bacillus mycoides]